MDLTEYSSSEGANSSPGNASADDTSRLIAGGTFDVRYVPRQLVITSNLGPTYH